MAASGRARFDLGDVFRAHGDEYRATHAPSYVELRVLRAMADCRTARLGGHLEVCAPCGFEAPAYNSCRDRHCPKCQSRRAKRWLAERRRRLLPTHYFHVVFTLPASLRPLARRHPRLVYDLLFASASRTLLELGENPARLGAQVGVTCVLHTWTRELAFHPHLHCLVTGGGLAPSGERWVPARRKHLFAVRVMSELYRGKFLAALHAAHQRGELDVEPRAFQSLLDSLYKIDWVVYAKAPFGDPDRVFRYLGRYTHRVGLSNSRLRSVDEHAVSFATKNGRVITLAPLELMRRFLLHVLPPGFVKIRHYGLWSSGPRQTVKLARARTLLAAPVLAAVSADVLVERYLPRCPVCSLPLQGLPLSASLRSTRCSSDTS